ncbi:hypothetical protein GEMRC1_012077 [Eukaryota sp. GEM-RC1]
MKTIVVFGATGNQGTAVVQTLLSNETEEQVKVRAFCRNQSGHGFVHLESIVDKPQSLECIQGDVLKSQNTTVALQNADCVVLILQPSAFSDDLDDASRTETEVGQRIVREALSAGVKDFVYSSVCCAGCDSSVPHFWSKKLIEDEIEKNRTLFRSAQIVRPTWFFENFDIIPPVRDRIQREKVFALPLPKNVSLPAVSSEDVGACLAKCALAPRLLEHHNNIIELCAELISPEEMANQCGFSYEQCDPSVFPIGYQNMFKLYEEQRVHPSIIDTLKLLPNSMEFKKFAQLQYPARDLKTMEHAEQRYVSAAGLSALSEEPGANV